MGGRRRSRTKDYRCRAGFEELANDPCPAEMLF